MKSLYTHGLVRHFQQSSQFYYIITDTKGHFKYVNSLFTKKSGYTSRQLSSLSFTDLIDEAAADKYNSVINECIHQPESVLATDMLCHEHDGSCFKTSWELSALLDKNNEPESIQWIGVEEPGKTITDSLAKTRDIQERYEAYEYSAEGLWKVDLKKPVPVDLSPEEIIEHCRKYGYLADCNDNLARMYGFSKAEELIGVSINDMMDLDDPKRIENLKEFISNDYHSADIETKEYDRNGNALYFLNNMKGIIENGMLKRIWGTQQDVTEKTKAEEQLQQSELFYRNLIADSLDGILLTNNEGIISFTSASVKKILGYEAEELAGKNAFDFLHPDDRAIGISAFYNEVEKSTRLESINARLLQKSGEWLWCMIRGHNMFENPHVGAMLIYFCDDTLRRNAITALTKSEQRFRHLIHNLNLGVILVNEKTEILICNQGMVDLFGFTEEQWIGVNVLNTSFDIIHEDSSVFSHSDFPISIAIQTKKPVRDIVMGISLSPGEDRMWLLVSADPVLDDQGNIRYIISSFTNITDLKRLSRQLAEQEIQKQKQLMQATIDAQEKERREIGRELHDNISQHLTTTRLYLEVAKDKAEGELLEMIGRAHKGMLGIVNEIRKISESLVPPSLNDIGLVESIRDLCDPLRNTHAFKVDFKHYQFDEVLLPDNMKLMLFRIIQEQVNNIIRHSNADSILISLQTSKHQLILSVADNGRGFDPATVKKGLGLDNISNRAGLFGGKLNLDTSPGRGCAIRVTIPLS